jgi:hypothetical protein
VASIAAADSLETQFVFPSPACGDRLAGRWNAKKNLKAGRGGFGGKYLDLFEVGPAHRFDFLHRRVSKPQPDEFRRMPAQDAQVVKIRIEGHHHETIMFCVIPNGSVLGHAHSQAVSGSNQETHLPAV